MHKLQKWAHIAEITGAVAVVISLLYVGYQVKENTDVQRSQTEMNLFSLSFDLATWYQDPGFVSAIARADEDWASLPDDEQMRVERYILESFNLWAYALKNFDRGQIDEGEWRAWDSFFTAEMQRPSWTAVYERYRYGYHEDFTRHVDRVTAHH